MSVLVRAAAIDAKAANQAEKDMNKLLDQKEKDLKAQKNYNRVLDKIEDARNDDNFTVDEKNVIILYAKEAGIDLKASDFAEINKGHASTAKKEGQEGKLYLTEAANGATALKYNKEIDDVKAKIERHQKAAENDSKGGDLKRNIAMNEYVQANKDSNATINRIKDLRAALSPAST